MEEDPLETVLRLVAEGRLSAEEASPILEALDAAAGLKPSAGGSSGWSASPAGSSDPNVPPGFGPDFPFGSGPGVAPGFAPGPGTSFAPGPGPGFAPGPGSGFAAGLEGSGRSLRVEVRDAGRTVVNLRLPLAIGRYAIDRIPGLSGDQVDRVRAALNSGMTGPVFVVDDGDDSVRIAIE